MYIKVGHFNSAFQFAGKAPFLKMRTSVEMGVAMVLVTTAIGMLLVDVSDAKVDLDLDSTSLRILADLLDKSSKPSQVMIVS